MKPEVRLIDRVNWYSALLSVLLFTMGTLAPLADATILKSADFETGDMSQVFAYIDPDHADTFSNFGIPVLPGSGSFAANLHSTTGVVPASHIQLIYNTYPLANGWLRFYFFIPTSWSMPSYNGTNNLKFVYPFQGTTDVIDNSNLNLISSGSGTTGTLSFYWNHYFTDSTKACFTTGIGTGWSLVKTNITRGAWHYIEINIDTTATNTHSNTKGVVKIWIDKDAATNLSSPTWTNVTCGDDNYNRTSTAIIEFNENWVADTTHPNEDWFADGMAWGDAVIGDTIGLLGNQPPPDTTPPAAPTGLIVQ
jgi:hypothetical protein